jgi:hypothetical protein
METPIHAPSVVVPLAPNPEYRVTVENLSKRYRLKSIVSDKNNLVAATLKLPPPAILPPPAFPATTSAQWSTAITIATTTGTTTVFTFPGIQQTALAPLPPVPTIEITLAETGAQTPRTGATLSGKLVPPFQRSIEVSGMPGTVYEDGSFEVKNVPQGRHTVLTRNNPAGTRPFGALIMVGDQDITNVPLQQILELPRNPDPNVDAAPRGAPGTILPLATVFGHLIDETTRARFNLERTIGRITINGNTVSYTINNTGDFEIQSLLPGRYELELWIINGATHTRTLEVRDDNITLEWPVSVPN